MCPIINIAISMPSIQISTTYAQNLMPQFSIFYDSANNIFIYALHTTLLALFTGSVITSNIFYELASGWGNKISILFLCEFYRVLSNYGRHRNKHVGNKTEKRMRSRPAKWIPRMGFPQRWVHEDVHITRPLV